MSQMGQTRPWRHVRVESVLHPTSDIGWCARHGRKVPRSDICSAASCCLFNHLVGAGKQRKRDSYPERLGGLEVNDQLNFRGLLDR
jgi:hypothetical protein